MSIFGHEIKITSAKRQNFRWPSITSCHTCSNYARETPEIEFPKVVEKGCRRRFRRRRSLLHRLLRNLG